MTITTAGKRIKIKVPSPCPEQYRVGLIADGGYIAVTVRRTDKALNDNNTGLRARLVAAVKEQQSRLDALENRQQFMSLTFSTREGHLTHADYGAMYHITVSLNTNVWPSDQLTTTRAILRAADGDGMRCIFA